MVKIHYTNREEKLAEAKAKELVEKIYGITGMYLTSSDVAIYVANEVLNEFPSGVIGSFERKRQAHWKLVRDKIKTLK